MLFITRRVGQSLMLGDDVEIVIEEVRGRTVKIAVRHPASVQVLRRELWERIRAENIDAVASMEILDGPEDGNAS